MLLILWYGYVSPFSRLPPNLPQLPILLFLQIHGLCWVTHPEHYADLLEYSNIVPSLCLIPHKEGNLLCENWLATTAREAGRVSSTLPHVLQFQFQSLNSIPVVEHPPGPVFPLVFYSLEISKILLSDSAVLLHVHPFDSQGSWPSPFHH